MKVGRQTSAKLVQARKQLFFGRLLAHLKGPGTNQVKIDFFVHFQIGVFAPRLPIKACGFFGECAKKPARGGLFIEG